MQPAAEELELFMQTHNYFPITDESQPTNVGPRRVEHSKFSVLAAPVISNVTAQEMTNPYEIHKLLIQQVRVIFYLGIG